MGKNTPFHYQGSKGFWIKALIPYSKKFQSVNLRALLLKTLVRYIGHPYEECRSQIIFTLFMLLQSPMKERVTENKDWRNEENMCQSIEDEYFQDEEKNIDEMILIMEFIEAIYEETEMINRPDNQSIIVTPEEQVPEDDPTL